MTTSTSLADQLGAAAEAASKRCDGKPLELVEIDPGNPDCLLSVWKVFETGDSIADIGTGLVYGEALIQKAKQFDTEMGRFMLEAVVHEIIRQGRVGPIERGFVGRIMMAAITALRN
jgi:hypothetical protein